MRSKEIFSQEEEVQSSIDEEIVVRQRGLEPPRDQLPQGPQPCASTSSATAAF